MNPAEFDKFADEYNNTHADNIRVSGETPEYFAEYKVRDMAAEYLTNGRQKFGISILDLGSGIGSSVPYIKRYLPQSSVICLDVSRRSLHIGRSRFSEDAQFVNFDGWRIPLADSSIDIAFAACVFHHIPRQQHPTLLRELRRVVCGGGLAFIFEHNPWNPLTRRAVNSCVFDENAELLPASWVRTNMLQVGFARAYVNYRIFFPRPLRAMRPLERFLRWLPFGAQYYVLGIK